MEAIQVSMLTLMALLVGMIVVVMFQLHTALRQMQHELRDARQRLEPMFEKLNSTSHVATAVAMAVAAGVRAYRDANHEESGNHRHTIHEEARR